MALSFNKVNKVITVLSPDTEITIQNLLNSIREWEDEVTSMDMPVIASCAGKEPLGGGVVVGLTLTLLDNWQLAFEARSGPTYTQCIVSGGNIVAVHTDGAIFPTAFTQVLITASSSATQSDLAAIQYSSYQNAIWVDPNGTTTGTTYPSGTRENPVNNIPDAVTIGAEKGFSTLQILDNLILSTGDVINGFELIGVSHINTTIEILDGCECVDTEIKDCNVSGVLDGGTVISDSIVGDIVYFNGHIHDCGLHGMIYLEGMANAVISDCKTIDQDDPPIIDMGTSGQSLAMPNYSGIVTVQNLNSATEEIGVGLNAGMVVIEDTIIDGTIIVSGNGVLSHTQTGSEYVNTDGLINRELITKATWTDVYYDSTSAESGTNFPIGTLLHPSNNLTELITIANANNIHNIILKSNLVLDTDVSGFKFDGKKLYNIDMNGATCAGSIFEYLGISGTQASMAKFDTCRLDNLQGLNGSYKHCVLRTTTPMFIATGGEVFMNNCRSGVPGADSPVLDYANGAIGLNNRAYSGGIRVINSTDPSNISTFEFIAGKFNFGSDNTAGDFHVRGVIDTTGIDISSTASLSYTGSVTTNREKEYGNVIYLDLDNGTSGQAYPIGLTSSDSASDNLTDALAIAATYDCSTIMLRGALTITPAHDISGITIKAARSLGNSVVVESGATTDGTYFENLTVSGVMNGSIRYTTCVVGAITNFDGGAKNCLMIGDITMTGTNSNYLTECDTYVTSSSYISIHQNAASLNIIRGRGRWGIFDKTSTNRTGIDLVAGYIYVDSTCNVGEVYVGGIGAVEDNSGAGCTVAQGAINDVYIANSVWDEPLIDHSIANTMGKSIDGISYIDKFIYIDTEEAINGNGKSDNPFNNVADAVDFAENVGWYRLMFLADATLERTLKNFTIEGIGLPTIDFNGQDVDKSEFLKVKLTGVQAGSITSREVVLLPGISNLDGIYKECGIVAGGTYTIADGAIVSITSASTLLAGTSPIAPIFDLGAATAVGVLSIRKYSGGIEIHNVNTANKLATLQFSGGKVVIDTSCSSGIIRVAGLPATATEDSSTGTTVSTDGNLTSTEEIWGYER